MSGDGKFYMVGEDGKYTEIPGVQFASLTLDEGFEYVAAGAMDGSMDFYITDAAPDIRAVLGIEPQKVEIIVDGRPPMTGVVREVRQDDGVVRVTFEIDRCGRPAYSNRVISAEIGVQLDPCYCMLESGHAGRCRCRHDLEREV